MCCCKGHLFCKSCVIENLLAQKKEFKRSKERWEEDQVKKKVEEQNKLIAIHNLKIESLKKVEDGVNELETDAMVENTRSDESIEKSRQIQDICDHKNLIPTREKTEMIKHCFWLPEKTPGADQAGETKPSEYFFNLLIFRKLQCPVKENNHFIKLKELINLKPMRSEETDKFSCCVCSKDLSVQKIVALKKCGHVMCKVLFEIYLTYLNLSLEMPGLCVFQRRHLQYLQ
jgi:nitric oxide synthase-interacting protein